MFILKAETGDIENQRRKGGERYLSSVSLLPKQAQCLGLGQSKVRSHKILPNLPCGFRNPTNWATFHCFPKQFIRELINCWKWSSQDSTLYPYRMPVLVIDATIPALRHFLPLPTACTTDGPNPRIWNPSPSAESGIFTVLE